MRSQSYVRTASIVSANAPVTCTRTVPPTSCPRVPLLLWFTPSYDEGFTPSYDEGFTPSSVEGFTPSYDEGFTPSSVEGFTQSKAPRASSESGQGGLPRAERLYQSLSPTFGRPTCRRRAKPRG
jgi:hypothetical protein